MKKEIITALIVFVVMILAIGYKNTYLRYEREAEVLYNYDGVVTVLDDHFNVWEFYGNGYQNGDKIILVMDNNNTDDMLDDIIVDVKR